MRFGWPAMAALGLLGGCGAGGTTSPQRDNQSADGTDALLTRPPRTAHIGSPFGGVAGAEAGTLHLSGTLSGFWGPCSGGITCSNTLVLQNNGGDNLALTDDGSFTFAAPMAQGEAYAITVLSQPPTKTGLNGGQTCVVSAGTGVAGAQGVTDVVVKCSTNYFTVGGTISGLLAGAQVTLSGWALDAASPPGGQPFALETGVTITGDGSPSQTFTFQEPGVGLTQWMAGSSYTLSVSKNPVPPRGQTCAFAGADGQGNAHGDVIDANITSLSLACTPLPYLYSFETGTEGWAVASWGGAGQTQQSQNFQTQGLSSMEIIALTGSTWFGVVYDKPLDLSGKTHLKWDIKANSATTQELAIQVGDSWTWCQGGQWPWLDVGTTTMDVDLTNLDCGAADLSQVHALYIYFTNGGGTSGGDERTYYLDNVRAE